jgi:hypothetical protein
MQVLISAPDVSESAAPTSSANKSGNEATPFPPDPALETVKELAEGQVSLATGSASALVRFAQDDANRARSELAIYRSEAGRARRDARFAWSAVALMAAAVTAAVGWTSHKLTQSSSDIRLMTDRAASIQLEAQKLLAERDSARDELQVARLAEADANGRLVAYMEKATKSPTTRPASVIQRIADAIAGE